MKPTLVIMAAGMGSRYGGLKQIEKIDEEGHIIMDFSLFDARRAGFEQAVFIIREENEALFRKVIGDKAAKRMKVDFAFQRTDSLPEGFAAPKGRVKPWGTAHAVLSCRGLVKGPLAVINADDYYGPRAFQLIYDFLTGPAREGGGLYHYAMVGYELGKTIAGHGHVSRGICEVDERGKLRRVTELTRIERRNGGIAYTEDDGAVWKEIAADATVSMNMWGFGSSILEELHQRFPVFLERELKRNPLKAEYYLPSAVSELLQEGRADVAVLKTSDQWQGVTYPEDKPAVAEALRSLKEKGLYPACF